jgi:hypothetical protein
MNMTEDFFWNLGGLLTLAAASAIVWHFCAHPDRWRRFQGEVRESSLRNGKGPPDAPA